MLEITRCMTSFYCTVMTITTGYQWAIERPFPPPHLPYRKRKYGPAWPLAIILRQSGENGRFIPRRAVLFWGERRDRAG
jgi:hypothetical protein